MNNSISVCLPIYNEAKSITKVIEEWINCLEKLSELVKINTIILTKENTGILPNSIKCIYTGSDKYLLLYLNVNTEDYDDFNLIVKNINKFIFEEEDFKNKFKEIIKKYCSKSFIKKD